MNRLGPTVKNLLIVNIAISITMLVCLRFFPFLGDALLRHTALLPSALLRGEVWQLITYMFIHLDPFHLLFNMLGLWILGIWFEAQWGSRSLLKFILLSGAGAGLITGILGNIFGILDAQTIGISGALNALLMAFAVQSPDRFVNLYGVLPVKAKHLVAALVGLDLLFALAGSRVNVVTHLGGLLMGYLLVTGKWRPSRWFARKRSPVKPPDYLRVVRPPSDKQYWN